MSTDTLEHWGAQKTEATPKGPGELAAALLVALAFSLAGRLAAPHLPYWACAVTVPLALLTVLWAIRAVVGARPTGLEVAAMMAVSLAGWAVLTLLPWKSVPTPTLQALRNLCLTVFGAGLGIAGARAVRDRNLLVPAGVFAAVIDIAVVYFGPTGRAVSKAPEVVAQFSLHQSLPGTAAPPPGAPPGAASLPPEVLYVGFLDVLLAAFMLAALARFGLRVRPAFWQMVLWLSLVGLASVFLGLPIPGWPFIVLAALLPNRDQFHFSRQEKMAMAVATVAAVGIVILVLRATARMW